MHLVAFKEADSEGLKEGWLSYGKLVERESLLYTDRKFSNTSVKWKVENRPTEQHNLDQENSSQSAEDAAGMFLSLL